MTQIPISSMRAAVLTAIGAPLEIVEVKLPDRLTFGQVLVRILYSGICGSQLGEIQGRKGPDPYLPHLLGHEATAEVVAVGEGVSTISPGDMVVCHWCKGTGLQAPSPVYSWEGSRVNAGSVTTFSEYSIVSENRVTRLTEGVDLEAASLLGCAVLTGYGVVNNDARVRIGESVVVVGAGGVGLNVIEGAALCSAYPIVGVDLHDSKLELAKRLGATHTLNTVGGSFLEEARAIVGSGGADVVVDTTGSPRVIADCYQLAGTSGRVILVGVPNQGEETSIYTLPLHFGKVLTGSHGGGSEPARDIPRYLRLARLGRVQLTELVTHRCSLDAINVAIDAMYSGKVTGRCVVAIADGAVKGFQEVRR